MEELKPCPFCKRNVDIVQSNDIPPHYGIHHFCGRNTCITVNLKWKPTVKEVIEAWNRRMSNEERI